MVGASLAMACCSPQHSPGAALGPECQFAGPHQISWSPTFPGTGEPYNTPSPLPPRLHLPTCDLDCQSHLGQIKNEF